ncbi:MAG: family 10 glycosylhydrolase [Verrucomicrobia bacterium]|nr:family 10 glycosylhydrolase [Verrucomicrobiota bacterium]
MRTSPCGGPECPLPFVVLRRLLSALVVLASSFLAGAAELRGLWVDAFNPGFKSAAEITQLVRDARAGGFNAVFVQVRRRGDAFYESSLEPRASELPVGFDPLAELLRQAHETSAGQRRLEVHAWIVAFNIWNRENTLPPQTNHPYRLHPDWLTQNNTGNRWDGANYAFDPGHPEVQDHTLAVVADLVSRYELDGLHLDYIRYAGIEWGFNPISVARFQRIYGRTIRPAPGDFAWLQFRRDQVTGIVRRIYLTATELRPALKVSAATITFAPGISETSAWTTSAAYTSVLQDWRAWMEEGILDLNVPMAYFRQSQWASAWTKWSQFAKDHRYGRHLALGAGVYLNPLESSLEQLRSTRLPTARSEGAEGQVLYSYYAPTSDGMSRPAFLAALTTGLAGDLQPPLYGETAEPPSMPWKEFPERGHFLGRALDFQGLPLDGLRIRMTGPKSRTLLVDANGWFGGVELDPGEYFLAATNAAIRYLGAVVVGPGQVQRPVLWPAEADTDLDGISNEWELIWETDPADPESVPQVQGHAAANGTLTLSWLPVSSRRSYRVEVLSELDSEDWQALPVTIPSGMGELTGIPLEGSARYFRVQPRVQP